MESSSLMLRLKANPKGIPKTIVSNHWFYQEDLSDFGKIENQMLGKLLGNKKSSQTKTV